MLDDEGLINLGPRRARAWNRQVLVAARDFPPDAVADFCGIDADRIRSLARELAGTPRAVVYGRIGLCNQEFGTLASWLVEVVNILTGHFGIEGGALFPRPAIATISSTARRRGPLKTAVEDESARAPRSGQAPRSCLAEAIAKAGEGQVHGSSDRRHTVLSAPDAGRLDDALPMLDAMVSSTIISTNSRPHTICMYSPRRTAALIRSAVGGLRCAAPALSPAILDAGDRSKSGNRAARRAILGGMPAGSRRARARRRIFTTAPRVRVDPDTDTGGCAGPTHADLTLRMSPWGDGYGARTWLDHRTLQPYDTASIRPVVITVGDIMRTARATSPRHENPRRPPRCGCAWPSRNRARASAAASPFEKLWLQTCRVDRGRDAPRSGTPRTRRRTGLATGDEPRHPPRGVASGVEVSDETRWCGEPAPRIRTTDRHRAIRSRTRGRGPNTNVLLPAPHRGESGNARSWCPAKSRLKQAARTLAIAA